MAMSVNVCVVPKGLLNNAVLKVFVALIMLGLTTPSLSAEQIEKTGCDLLAAHPEDPQNPPGVSGILFVGGDDLVTAERVCAEELKENPESSRALFLYGRVLWASGDVEGAASFFDRSASDEYPMALHMLGLLRLEQERYSEAFSLLHRASTYEGYDNAKYDAGTLLYYGIGTDSDIRKGIGLVEEAAENGFVPAMPRLAEFLLEQEKEAPAKKWLKLGLKHRDVDAYLLAARLSLEGEILERDFEKAQAFLNEAYLRGSHKAGYLYAKLALHRMGESPPKGFDDYLDRMTSINKAIEFSLNQPKDIDEKINLQIVAYYKFIKVIKLVFVAEAKGNADAALMEAEAIENLRRHAETGSSIAQFGLGELNELDMLPDSSLERAIFWYVKAKNAGNPKAGLAVERLCKTEGKCYGFQ